MLGGTWTVFMWTAVTSNTPWNCWNFTNSILESVSRVGWTQVSPSVARLHGGNGNDGDADSCYVMRAETNSCSHNITLDWIVIFVARGVTNVRELPLTWYSSFLFNSPLLDVLFTTWSGNSMARPMDERTSFCSDLHLVYSLISVITGCCGGVSFGEL